MRHLIPALLTLAFLSPPALAITGDDDRGAATRLIPKLKEDERERGCLLWNGHATDGNDPTVSLRIRLCPDPDNPGAVFGRTIWHSPRSGYSLRAVRGTFDPEAGTYTLQDTELLEEKPNPGWYFCTIDVYTLTRHDDDALSGTYDSSACSDHANLELTLER